MKMYKIIRIGLLALLMIALLVSGCVDEKNTTSPTTSSPTTPSQTTKPPFKELSFFEDKLVGKWSRYHRYDGSTEYYIFKSDRTACYFEIIDSSRKNEKYYSYWELDPSTYRAKKYENAYEIDLKTSDSSTYTSYTDIFDYVNDVIYLGGYDNLKMTRDSTSRDCSKS